MLQIRELSNSLIRTTTAIILYYSIIEYKTVVVIITIETQISKYEY